VLEGDESFPHHGRPYVHFACYLALNNDLSGFQLAGKKAFLIAATTRSVNEIASICSKLDLLPFSALPEDVTLNDHSIACQGAVLA
jgi:hypothetical protein